MTDLYNHHHGQSISSRGRETPTKRQPEKEKLYNIIGSLRKRTASKLFFPEELSVISALHINPIHHFTTAKLVM